MAIREEKMEISNEIGQIFRLVYGEGDACDLGCAIEDIPKMISLSKKMVPIKPYRVVRHWCGGDLEVDVSELEGIKQAGMKPAFIYAGELMEDERGEWRKGVAVKTTLLVEFHLDCLFITRNTAYILVGTGRRMTVNWDVFLNLTF